MKYTSYIYNMNSQKGNLRKKGKLLRKRKCLLKNTDKKIACQTWGCEPWN